MRKWITICAVVLVGSTWAQTEEELKEIKEKAEEIEESSEENDPDTVQFKVGRSRVIVITPKETEEEIDLESDAMDTIDAAPEEEEDDRDGEAKWSGLEIGYNINTNAAFGSTFSGYKYWENDPAKSIYFNLNIAEHRFRIVKEYVGITTGIGINFNSIAFKSNYELIDTVDMVYAKIGESEYSKNKLKASYVQVPLLLQFNSNRDNNRGMYLSAGVIGGARLTSKLKRKGTLDDQEFEEKKKGVYALNPFKLDATIRIGYKNIGGFVNYSLMPLFETSKTVGVYPLTFGATFGI